MKWTPEHEECFHVIGRILIRQLGIPEATQIITDYETWNRLYPDGSRQKTLKGLSQSDHFVIWVNVDDVSNFYDAVVCLAHELFHVKRPRVKDEYKIQNWAAEWINNEHYKHIDLSKM